MANTNAVIFAIHGSKMPSDGLDRGATARTSTALRLPAIRQSPTAAIIPAWERCAQHHHACVTTGSLYWLALAYSSAAADLWPPQLRQLWQIRCTSTWHGQACMFPRLPKMYICDPPLPRTSSEASTKQQAGSQRCEPHSVYHTRTPDALTLGTRCNHDAHSKPGGL